MNNSKIIIDSVTAHVVEVKVGFTYSTSSLNKGRAIIWEVKSGSHVGIGEARLSGESSILRSGFKSHLKAKLKKLLLPLISKEVNLKKNIKPIATKIIGSDPLNIENILFPLPKSHKDYFSRWTREGLSIALFDLAGKIQGVPVHKLLGGARRKEVPGMPVIHVAEPVHMGRLAKCWTDSGYRFLKVKFRGLHEEDVESIKSIRDSVGFDIPIQVDSNHGYTKIDQAARVIEGLKDYNIDCYEDMLNAPIEQIAELRHRTGARIMVDGYAYWPYVNEVIRAGAADIINHHPNNQGGLGVALLINAAALAAGLETSIGSSGLFGIQNTAFQMLSAVIGLPRPCEDIGLVPYYSGPTKDMYDFDCEPNVLKQLYTIVNGTIQIPDNPGLGVEIDRDKLENLTIERFEFSV